MHNQTLAQLSAALAKKEISSEELTKHYLARIAEHDKELNAFITVCEDEALANARSADQARAKGANHPLLGMPIAQKDIFCTQGIKTSCGSKMLDNFISPYDATVIAQFNAAGAVILGKTNMDAFAMGSSNETSYYGPVANPWDIDTVPGGSSGGSAAAVCARLAPAATGTDTGGSIRQPAAFCGITGLKPTYGRVSRYGMVAFASSLDQAGPMTQTAEDAAILLNTMAGFDPKDSTSVDKAVPDYTASLKDSIAGLTIGLPKEYFAEGIDKIVADVLQDAIRVFESLGAKVVDVSLPHAKLAVPTYYIVAPAECSSNLSRFDGVRFGYRCDNPSDLHDLYFRTRSEGFSREVKRRIMIGTYVLSSGYYDAYYLQAQKARQLIARDFTEAFAKADVLLGPTTPTTSFKHGEKMKDPISMYFSDIFTIAVNLAGITAISIPCGEAYCRPVGLQLIGNYFEEAKILGVAHQYQQATNWHTKMPEIFG